MSMWRTNSKVLVPSLLLFTIIFLLLRHGTLLGQVSSNMGFATLNEALSVREAETMHSLAAAAMPFFADAVANEPRDLSSQRGLALSRGLQLTDVKPLPTLEKLGGDAAENYALLGDAANRLGRHEQALFWYKQAIDRSPNNFLAWMKLADTYQKIGDLEKATAAYEQAWSGNPSSAFKPYVSALIQQGDIVSAEDVLNETLNSGINFYDKPWGWHTLALLQQDQEKWDAAYNTYGAGLAEFEDNASLLVGLGWLLYEQENDRDAALSQFTRAIDVNNDSGVGYFAMGQLMAKEKNYSEAEIWFKAALERNDSNPRWRLVRANTARESTNYDLAVRAYKDVIHRFPSYAPAYYELAVTYKLLDSPSQAVQILEQAQKLFAQPLPRHYLTAAEIYEWSGKVDQAVEIYQKLLDLDPGNQEVLQRLNQLQND